MANPLCIPCSAVDHNTECTNCVLSALFPQEELSTFLVLFDHFGTLSNLQRRLQDLKNTEDRNRWVYYNYRAATLLLSNPVGGCMEELDRCKEQLENYQRKYGPLREERRDIRDTVNVEAESSYRGLVNHGATCYLNAIVQCLYHIPLVRQVIHAIPTSKSDDLSKSIPFALQQVFFDLQFGDDHVPTTELIVALGWDSHVQRDAQEFVRTLIEKLDNEMKGTSVEGKLRPLFHGIEEVFYYFAKRADNGSNVEHFYEIQLVVKGCHNVYDSLDKYVADEILEGNNAIRVAGSEELQDAVRNVHFLKLPCILLLHLLRFSFEGGTAVKVNERFEYPLQLDLDKYVDVSSNSSISNLYKLYSVVTHSGTYEGGHYYTYLREAISDKWFKFDDKRVNEEKDLSVVLDDQYGGRGKEGSAYLLIYVRASDIETMFNPVKGSEEGEYLEDEAIAFLNKKVKLCIDGPYDGPDVADVTVPRTSI